MLGMLIAKISYFPSILSNLCTFVTFKSGLACSDTINITMQCFYIIHLQFYDNLCIVRCLYNIDKSAAPNITYFYLMLLALK